jgi:hypothetical protein
MSLDHNGLVTTAIAIAILTLADHLTLAIAIAARRTHGHAYTSGTNANTDSDVLCARRLHEGNSSYRDGSDYNMLDHRMFLSMNYHKGKSRTCELFRATARGTYEDHPRMPNQITAATIATMIAAQMTGETFFELPLRGETLAAWLNSVFMT